MREHLPEIVSAVLITVALALATLAWQRFERMQQRQVQAQREDRALRQAILELRQNHEDTTTYGPRFHALRTAGSVGAFDKPRALDDFEARTRAFGDQLRDYSLAAQTLAEVPGASSLQHHELFRHQLDFQLRPLHEDAFVALLATLRTTLGGTSAIESCNLARPLGGAASELTARCTLNWYSFVPRNAATGGSGAPR